jgi:thimet oligopeptidase
MSRLFLAALPALATVACSATAKTPAPAPSPVAAAPVEAEKVTPARMKPHEQFKKQCADDLAAAREHVARAVASKERTVAGTLQPYNEALLLLHDASGRAELFGEVHPDADFRAAADDCTKEVERVSQDLLLDRSLFEAVSAVPEAGLDANARRFREHALRDFRRAGVDKDDETRAKLKELKDEMVDAGLAFDKNIRDDVRRARFDPAELAGLPQDYLDAHKPGPDGKVEISTDYPDYFPFRTFVKNPDARRRLYLEFMARGYPQNDEQLRRLLVARKRFADLLGYASWADYATEDKMMKSAKNAQEFIDKIAAVAEKRGRADLALLLARKKKDDPKAKQVAEYERYYYEELVKREKFAFDSQSVRPYFEYSQTRDGLLATTSKLFNVEFRPIKDAEVWHEEVDVYDVFQKGERLGRIYLDMHPRENKYKHAAQATLVNGLSGKQLPEGVLMCNFANPRTSSPALMGHEDVVTMFHEFGHLLHHVLAGRQQWASFSGVATEWDFVEAPSQMLEEWAFDPETLARFALHVETKQPIPAELVKKLKVASEFGDGIEARRQMYLAAMSLRFHTEDPAKLDFKKVMIETQKKYHLFPYLDGTYQYANFGHLNGYSAIYYTYMWSLVIAKDLFSEFQKKGLYDTPTAERYRDRVLVPGGSKDAADLVKDFLGRPYSFESYRRWLEQT